MIEGKVKALFSDKERTELLFPITKTSAITNDDGVGLDAIISDTVYSDTNAIKATAVPVNADTLGGKPADEFATQNYVAAEIAKAQLNGGDVDLSGFATKDDVSNAVNGIDFPVDSVNGKTGVVVLSASEVGATPASHAEDKNNPHNVTPAQIGAAPAGYVAYTGWFNSDDMLTTKLTEAYAGIADNKIGFAELESTSNTITLTQGKWFFTMYRSSAEYGVVTAIRYDSTNVVVTMHRSLIGGVWGAWKNGSPSAFAPAGYGYGEPAASIGRFATEQELNTAFSAIVNKIGDYESKQILFVDAITGEYSCSATVYRFTEVYAFVEVRIYATGGVYHKRLVDGTWQPIEWINPPMIPGVEYRTTERWNGKAVYTCLVNCGSVAGDGVTSTYPNLNITQCISCEACSTTGDSFPVKWVDISDIYVNAYANKTAIHVYTSGGYSTTATIYAKLRYTKD